MTKDKIIEEIKNYDKYSNGLSKECRDYIINTIDHEILLEKIRAEMHTAAKLHEDGDYYLSDQRIDEIIDKYNEGYEFLVETLLNR